MSANAVQSVMSQSRELPRQLRNVKGPLWLNVGSSAQVLPDFINLDNHIALALLPLRPLLRWLLPTKYNVMLDQHCAARSKAVLLRHDCRKPLPFPDASVDHILCSHFLEHLYLDEAERTLKDYYRVLKPGCTLHVIVPDLALVVEWYLAAKGRPTAADDFVRNSLLTRESRGTAKYRVLEFMGGFGLQHRWMYDAASLAPRLTAAGFELLAANDTPSRMFKANDRESVHFVACRPVQASSLSERDDRPRMKVL